MLTDVIFKGTNSKLFGKYYKSNNEVMPIVLILYPETKNDNIPQAVNAVCDILKENEFSYFLFNFKKLNTRKIDEEIDKKEEELLDVISALNWISSKYSESKILWLFSFFSTCPTGLQIAMRRPEITDYALFSPPVKFKDFSFIVPSSAAGLIVYESTLPNSVDEIVEKLSSKSDSKIETLPLEVVNLEKGENLELLAEPLNKYIEKRLADGSGRIKKIRRDRRRRKKKKLLAEEEKTIHISPIKSLEFD